jgi:hypothetical protein
MALYWPSPAPLSSALSILLRTLNEDLVELFWVIRGHRQYPYGPINGATDKPTSLETSVTNVTLRESLDTDSVIERASKATCHQLMTSLLHTAFANVNN